MLERDYVIPILNKWTDILRLKKSVGFRYYSGR